APAAGGARSLPRMADGELSGPLSPRLHPDPRHAGRARLRLAMGHADEGHRADGVDDRPPLRDCLREAGPEQAPHEIDDGPFRQAEGPAVELVLAIVIASEAKQSIVPLAKLWIASPRSLSS